jgi:hypothetical protein
VRVVLRLGGRGSAATRPSLDGHRENPVAVELEHG